MYQLRSFRGRALTEERLASASGPAITLIVGSVCVALGLSVLWKGEVSGTTAEFWPPAGAALVAFLVVPPKRWGWVFAGVLFPTFMGIALGLMPTTTAGWWALGNCSQPAFAAAVLRRFAASRWCTPGRIFLLFFGVGVVIAPMLGGAIGAIGNVIGYDARWFDAWLEWVLADGLGVLVVVPLLFTSASDRSARRSHYEVVALIALVGASTGLTFAHIGHGGAVLLPYVILVAMIWAGMRFGTRVVATTGFIVAMAANVATSAGYGPFSAENAGHVITLQIFLVIALVTSLVVASTASQLADSDEVSRLLTHQAHHDALTGLPNRVFFTSRLTAALAADHDESGSGLAVILIDLDDFTKLNDRYGRPAGDRALRLTASLLRCGIGRGDLLARLGKDEFVVLCTGLTGPEAVAALAAELHFRLVSSAGVASDQYPLSASMGAAYVDEDDPVTPEDLVNRASIALSRAKDTREVKFAMFDDALEAHSRRRVEIAEELHHSIDRGEMSVAYQPIFSIETGRLTEFEALVRWNNRRFGPVGPDEFIPIAEEDGFIIVLGDWVLKAACEQLATWRTSSPGHDVRIAVNVSARQLSDVVFPNRVRAILAAADLRPSALTLEITETAVMYDSATSELVLEDLRQIGIRLSMDDFGTGYSSMSNLQRTPLDVLKIDRSFVAGVGHVIRDTAIVASIIQLGHSFGLEVVAEGIETPSQLAYLQRLGCDYGQGYYWSRAVDAAGATDMLDRSAHSTAEVSMDSAAFGHDGARPQMAAREGGTRATRTELRGLSAAALAPYALSAKAHVTSSSALLASPDDSSVTSMLRGLLRIRAPHEAARLLQEAAVALGGTLVSAADAGPDALPLDLSLGEGTPMLVEADPMSLARLQIERFLPRLTEDAREAVDLLRHSERMEDESNTDRLTGLPNRRVLDRVLPGADEGAVMIIDIDHFKQLNDSEGHLAGDAVLSDFGRMLRDEVRATDVCCRYGGEEFVILATGTTTEEAVELTDRLRRAWARTSDRPITFSAGVAAIGGAGGRAALAAADRALYRAKELGRDRTEVHAR